MARYNFKFEAEAEGENAISKHAFENQFTIEKLEEHEDGIVISINADSTLCSNPDMAVDGEVTMVYAMIGINLKAKVDPNGQLM